MISVADPSSVSALTRRSTFSHKGRRGRRTLDGERQRISISIPKRDLARLKTRAAEEGMPYQTLFNSILHNYLEKG